MEILPLFSVGLGRQNEKDLLPPARRVFEKNTHIMQRVGKSYTNFIEQNPVKHRVNSNYKNPEDVQILKEKILEYGCEFLKRMNYYHPSYVYEVTNIWFNTMIGGDWVPKHEHYGYILSGCYYVDVPENSGKIEFFTPLNRFLPSMHNASMRYTEFNSEFWQFEPKEGDLYFWFSNLEHCVPAINFVGKRQSVSFDISIALEHPLNK